MPAATKPRSRRAREGWRTYVLDTSVLLSDPRALYRFDEHEVVVPLVVVMELEAKRTHPELGYFARQALRLLDDLRIEHGRLDEQVPLNDQGGVLRVELNHSDMSRLPTGMQVPDNDTRILAVARNLAAEGRDVVVVSKDLPLRVKASTLGLQAEEYRAELVVSTGWTGVEEVDGRLDGGQRALRQRAHRLRGHARPSLQHRGGADLRARLGAGPGDGRQAAAPGPR